MWLDNLKELKKKTGMSAKQIADKTNLPERTINRIFAGETDHPYADTLDLIVKALGYDLGDIFADTKVIVATDDLVEIKENVDVVEAERDLILVENDMLKSKVSALTTELELLKKELVHKEELLALHNYYKIHIEQLIKKEGNVIV
jgi:transcriptional regulator with XRE-family HTH domain